MLIDNLYVLYSPLLNTYNSVYIINNKIINAIDKYNEYNQEDFSYNELSNTILNEKLIYKVSPFNYNEQGTQLLIFYCRSNFVSNLSINIYQKVNDQIIILLEEQISYKISLNINQNIQNEVNTILGTTYFAVLHQNLFLPKDFSNKQKIFKKDIQAQIFYGRNNLSYCLLNEKTDIIELIEGYKQLSSLIYGMNFTNLNILMKELNVENKEKIHNEKYFIRNFSLNRTGRGGSKTAWIMNNERVLLLPNMNSRLDNPISYWGRVVNEEIYMSKLLTKNNLLNPMHQEAFVILNNCVVPCYISINFSYFKQIGWYVIDAKNSSTELKLNITIEDINWENIISDLYFDAFSMYKLKLNTGGDSFNNIIYFGKNIISLLQSGNKSLIKPSSEDISLIKIRYFGFDFTSKIYSIEHTNYRNLFLLKQEILKDNSLLFKEKFINEEYHFFHYVKTILTESIINFAYEIGIGDDLIKRNLLDVLVTHDNIFEKFKEFNIIE